MPTGQSWQPPHAATLPTEQLPVPASGLGLAVAAESLFLVNLLLAPGLAFAVLFWLWRKHPEAPPLARNHLGQTFFVSLWGGLLLTAVTGICLALGGLHWEWTWVLVIMYFTCVHSALVVLGIFGLARAMAGKPYRFPLIGPALES